MTYISFKAFLVPCQSCRTILADVSTSGSYSCTLTSQFTREPKWIVVKMIHRPRNAAEKLHRYVLHDKYFYITIKKSNSQLTVKIRKTISGNRGLYGHCSGRYPNTTTYSKYNLKRQQSYNFSAVYYLQLSCLFQSQFSSLWCTVREIGRVTARRDSNPWLFTRAL